MSVSCGAYCFEFAPKTLFAQSKQQSRFHLDVAIVVEPEGNAFGPVSDNPTYRDLATITGPDEGGMPKSHFLSDPIRAYSHSHVPSGAVRSVRAATELAVVRRAAYCSF